MRTKITYLLIVFGAASALWAAPPEPAKTPAKKNKIGLATVPWRQDLDNPPQVKANEAVLPWYREFEHPTLANATIAQIPWTREIKVAAPVDVSVALIPWTRAGDTSVTTSGVVMPVMEPIVIEIAELPWRR